LPDENIMKILIECLLDCHPVLAPAKDTKTKAKAGNKIPKAHAASLKKNELIQYLIWKLSTCLSSENVL